MNGSLIIFGTVVSFSIVFVEWSNLKKTKKKEKFVFISFLLAGWILSLLLAVNPNVPGPSQWIQFLFGPFGRMLEK